MDVVQFVTDSLGDASYLVVSGAHAAVVDPQRDVRPYLEAAAARGATIERVFETHVHNDYLSGGRELSALGARIVAPASSGLEFEFDRVDDGDEVSLGEARLRAVAAPGHTYEHTAYLAIDEASVVVGVFSGGSIIIGGAGRTDLVGEEHTERLTRLQWESAQRIAGLVPPSAEVLPTHGAGSFCSAGGGSDERRAPLEDELARNPVLTSAGFEEFRETHLDGLPPIPDYYAEMASLNRRGPRAYGVPPTPAALDAARARRLAAEDVPLLDVRDRFAFARGHVPRSLSVEESDSMLAYASWLLPFDSPFALVAADQGQANRVAIDFLRIGFERVRGALPFEEWRAAGEEVATLDTVSVGAAARVWNERTTPILDVRFPSEHLESGLPGTRQLSLHEINGWLGAVEEDRVIVGCATGQRAVTAASVLLASGRHPLALIDGGIPDLAGVRSG